MAGAQEASNADELAKKLSNPVAALISVPIQYNYDETFGDDGYRHTVNVQPVIPVSISEDWNLISRTILPILSQDDVIPGTDQSGFGDIVQSIFFSPKAPTSSGIIWGVGPAAILPSGSSEFSADTWALGPTAVVLKQTGPWTVGALANHLEDVSGDAEISATFVQPFLSYALGRGRTVTLNTESTYNWEAEQWTVPVNLTYSKVTRIGSQLVSIGGGVRGYLESPTGGPDWGLRLVFTLLYPR
ncbi:MAG: transporter [Gammaproteobacteria bacterium]|nr:transporter [Gammaproteobacteria bacterium]